MSRSLFDLSCAGRLEKVLSPSTLNSVNPWPADRCGEFNNRMKRVPVARLLVEVGLFGSYHRSLPNFWRDFTFAVEIFHQNPYSCLSRVFRTLDLYYKVNERVPEHRNLVGAPVLQFDVDEDCVYTCCLCFNDDVRFRVYTWFKFDEGKAMDPEKLKRKIMSGSFG